MKLRRFLPVLAGFLLLNISALYAGDSASFVDLGFSPDGSIYMFAQYGVKSGVLVSWADLFVVDVKRNDFVRGGRISYTHDSPIAAGQDGSGALYRLIAQNAELAKRHGIMHPDQGQPLYVSMDGDPAFEGNTISFRDFVSGTSYRASLLETINGSDENLKSTFYINLECTDSEGDEKTYTVGSPEIKRPLIASYRIKRVLISPPGNSLIFVIEMKRQGENGPDIRYMAEALRF